jgi:hypothetical protein
MSASFTSSQISTALEVLPPQGVGPQHVQGVLGVGRRVVKERDAHTAGRDLAADALDIGEHPGGQLVLVGVLARQAYGEVLDETAHVRGRLLGACRAASPSRECRSRRARARAA